MIIQLQGIDHFNQFTLLLNQKKVGGTVPAPIKEYYDNFWKYSEPSDRYKLFGYFEDNNLISAICLGFWENKSRGRFWMIPGLFTIKKHNFFSFNNPEIGLLIKKAFELAEENCYYEYYYCIAEHVSHVYERQIDKNKYIPLKRYDRITLDIVEKNTLPTTELYLRLIGESTKPHNIIIKKRVLKQQFRHF